MLLDGLGWSHYSVFAPCIMTQTRVLGRSGGGQILFANVVAYVFLFGIVSKLVTFSGNSVLLMGTSCLCSVVLGIYGSLIMIQFSKRLCQVGTIT